MLKARPSPGAPTKVVKVLIALLVAVGAWPGLMVNLAHAAPMTPGSNPVMVAGAPARAALNAPADDVVLQGHITLFGRGTPPNSRWSVPITLTTQIGAEDPVDYLLTTDEAGYFTATMPVDGTYNWWVKNPQTLANTG